MGEERKSITDRKWYPWFICAMSFTIQFVGMSFHGSFGPLYVKMLRHFQERDTKTAWVASMSFALSLSISPITYRVDERIGQRSSMMIASGLFGLGLLISSFATSLDILFFTIGVLVAVGLSFCQAASMFILPHYFEKNYVLALGIALSGGSLGSLALSNLKAFMFAEFSYQTSMQLLASTSIILFFCGLTFKHPKKKRYNVGKEPSSDKDEIDDEYPPLSRNKSFYVLLLASLFYHVMYLFGFVHLPRMAIDLGVSDAQAALLPGILALSESAGKVVSGRIISYYRDSTLHLYQGAWLGMSLSSFACPFSKSFVGLGLYAAFWGFCVGNASGSCVGVIHYLVGRRRLVRAYSIFLLGLSPSVLAGPPIAGWLRETTLSYDAAFYTAGGTVMVAAGLLSVVKILHRIQHDYMKKVMTNNNAFEEAESAASGERDEFFDEKLFIAEKEKKFNLLDYTGNEVEEQVFLQKYQDGKMTDSEILFFQVDKVNLQRWIDISKETSI